jgi:putative ABC transport system permease protein
MSILHALRARLRALLHPSAADRSLGEEIQFHIELETEKNLRLGLSPEEARRRAVAHFGGVQRVREDHRDVRPMRWLEDAVADTRYGLRALRRAPALGTAAVVTLALGIGANVAIFSAVNAVVLRPLPLATPDRLVMITEENPEKHWHLQTDAPANVLDWKAGVSDFADVMAYADFLGTQTLTGRGEPRPVQTTYVSGNFFSVVGARAAIGRTFVDDETWQPNALVVLSDRGWRSRFGGDSSIVGKAITLDGRQFQVVGIMPPGFAFPFGDADLWRTIGWNPADRGAVGFRRAHWVRAVARLKPGVSFAHADAQLQGVVSRLKRDYPATNKYMGAAMWPLQSFLVGDTRLPLLLLLTSVAFLLLIACANVGNLLLVQAAGREREAALRLALGAGRGRLVRQALAESLTLSCLGGLLGLALGWTGTRALVRLQPAGMLRVHDFGVDGAVLGYVVAITVVSGLLFGVAPAFWMRKRDPATSLKDGGRGVGQGARARRWGEALVIGEVALALLMTTAAGLIVRSFLKVKDVNPGFDSHGVLTAQISLSRQYDTSTKVLAFMSQLEDRTRALPGATTAALATSVPFMGTSYTSDYIAYGRPADGYGTEIGHRTVTPSYFTAMRVPLLRGRMFNETDRMGSEPVVLINDALAKSYFQGQDPVGQRIAFDKVPTPKSTWYSIIGVVGNEHVDALDVQPRIEAFNAMSQEPRSSTLILARTDGDPSGLVGALRAVVHDLDPTLALIDAKPLDDLRAASLARIRFLTTMLLGFAIVGLVLAVVGVYGVLAHVSRNRTREMGIRVALGAQASQVRWLVVRHGLALAVAGLVLGLVAASFATRLMAKLLFNVAPNDPLTLIGVSVLLAATSMLAASLPARRASRVDPAIALRAD